MNVNYDFAGISKENLARLFMLATYVGYDGNRLQMTERTPMRRKDVPNVLGLKSTATKTFLKEVTEKGYLRVGKNGDLFINDCVYRGSLKSMKRSHNEWYIRYYFEGIRNLYTSVTPRQHKYVGLICSLLPYVNVKYNVLCKDPFESDIRRIQALSIADIYNITGMDKSHINRFKSVYSKMRFNVDGHKENFLAVLDDGVAEMVFVNPNLFSFGSTEDIVEFMSTYFCHGQENVSPFCDLGNEDS